MGDMPMNPEWVQELKTNNGNSPDEAKIARVLIEQAQMHTCNGQSYNLDGELKTKDLEEAVADLLVNIGFKTNLAKRVNAIVSVAKMLSNGDGIPLKRDEIPVKDGTVFVKKDGSFYYKEEKHLSSYRLKCGYNPDAKDITHFRQWLDDLFSPEDQYCFQEVMGYLLLPTTQAQKAFFLLGTGGEGKSIWGTILYAMFGNGFVPTKVCELEGNRFTIATIENKIVAYDDDLNQDKLEKTDNFKTIVSAKIPVMGERKGTDKFEFLPYARICACGNFSLSSLHDTSDGFFRRLLPIRVKNKPPERKDISDYEQLILPELDAIFLWSLEGLQRLIKNDYKFSESERSKELLTDIREESNSFLTFIENELVFEQDAKVSGDALQAAYKNYCYRTEEVFRGGKYGMIQYLKSRMETYGITDKKNIGGDKRGFVGVRLKKAKINLDEILGKDGGRK